MREMVTSSRCALFSIVRPAWPPVVQFCMASRTSSCRFSSACFASARSCSVSTLPWGKLSRSAARSEGLAPCGAVPSLPSVSVLLGTTRSYNDDLRVVDSSPYGELSSSRPALDGALPFIACFAASRSLRICSRIASRFAAASFAASFLASLSSGLSTLPCISCRSSAERVMFTPPSTTGPARDFGRAEGASAARTDAPSPALDLGRADGGRAHAAAVVFSRSAALRRLSSCAARRPWTRGAKGGSLRSSWTCGRVDGSLYSSRALTWRSSSE
mmetsp:Transcript_8643/g.21343  ORF Transcript_8643/g.21343 Transcript_8643/m.21343 type:complete len:273 (-) Transcript_8643:792-1610(-)